MKRDPLTYEIIGAGFNVHAELGPGFLEAVYHEALIIEMNQRGVPYLHEVQLPIQYKGITLSTKYRADFVCFKNIIVEIKALNHLSGKENSQILNYMKASGFKKGLLLNFGSQSLEHKRFVI